MAHHPAQPQYPPPQPNHAQQQPASNYTPSTSNTQHAQPTPGPLILHVHEEGLTHRHRRILSSDNRTPLYTITANSGGAFSSKPHVSIMSASTNAVIGSITFHTVSSNIDLTIHNQPVNFNHQHEFRSLATGANFKWKKDGIISGGDMVCLDERKQRVAWYEHSTWAVHKDGKIGVEGGVEGGLVDEIVVTLIAMLEVKRRENGRSAAAG